MLEGVEHSSLFSQCIFICFSGWLLVSDRKLRSRFILSNSSIAGGASLQERNSGSAAHARSISVSSVKVRSRLSRCMLISLNERSQIQTTISLKLRVSNDSERFLSSDRLGNKLSKEFARLLEFREFSYPEFLEVNKLDYIEWIRGTREHTSPQIGEVTCVLPLHPSCLFRLVLYNMA